MGDVSRDYEQHVERRARAIRPEAWNVEPTSSFRGMQPKGTSNDDVLKSWWQAYSDQRYDARIRARATMEADRAAGYALCPREATEGMAEAAWEEIPYGVYYAPKSRIESAAERAVNAAVHGGDILGGKDA